MAAKRQASSVPSFAAEKTIGKPKAVCKLKLDKTDVKEVGEAVAELVEQAKDAGVEVTAVRGTLTAY